MIIKNKSGLWGETYAARHLRSKGYDILGTNYSTRFGEIDIVAVKRNTICFVEVKTRNVNSPYAPSEAVDIGKQNRMIMASRQITEPVDAPKKIRFDVCEVLLNDDYSLKSLNYIKNAFSDV